MFRVRVRSGRRGAELSSGGVTSQMYDVVTSSSFEDSELFLCYSHCYERYL